MDPRSLLLNEEEIRTSVDSALYIRPAESGRLQPVGEVLRSAAVDSAYARFDLVIAANGQERPVTVGDLVLIFDSDARARHTFAQVAEAAHLRTDVEGAQVAVETATAASGVVSYWGFVHRGAIIVVLTVDTLDPNEVSMSDFRQLVLRAADHLKGRMPA